MLIRPDLCVGVGLKLSSLSLYSNWNFTGANVFYDVPGLSFAFIYHNFFICGVDTDITVWPRLTLNWYS